MIVVVLLVLISLVLVAAALVFFFTRMRGGDFDHGERLALLPLLDDDGAGNSSSPAEKTDRAPTDKEDGELDANR